MATYYVKPTGSDGAAGTSDGAAWATPAKAFSTCAAGDTCYFAPGTYRIATGWSLTNAGSAGNLITYEGDPDCVHFTGEKPGYVRLTGCDTNDLPTSSTNPLFNFNGKRYVTLKYLVIDGQDETAGSNGVQGDGYADQLLDHCIVFNGGAAVYNCASQDCLVVGGYDAFYSCPSATRCVGFGGFESVTTCTNCICIGGAGFWACTNLYSCVCIGANWGYHGGTAYNCEATSCWEGFHTGTFNNCIAIGNRTVSGIGATLNSCKSSYNRFSGTTQSGHTGWVGMLKISQIIRALRWELHFDTDMGTATNMPSTDIMNYDRALRAGSTPTPGVYEWSSVATDFSNEKTIEPAIKITTKGYSSFFFAAESGKEYTVSIWTKFDVAGDKPQLILKGTGISTQTDTAAGDGSAYEELAVSATPDRDCELEIQLYQRDTTSAKYALFSDLSITVA